jgi:hypothetical protein
MEDLAGRYIPPPTGLVIKYSLGEKNSDKKAG